MAGVHMRRPGIRQAARHRRRLVRIGRVVGGGRRGQAGAGGREGRPLPRGRRPAPRLVPLVAADGGGDARPGALQGGADARLGARRARQGVLEVGDREGTRRRRQARATSTPPSGWRRTAPSCCGCGPPRPTTRATSSSRTTILGQLGESYRKIRNTCRYLLSNLYDFVPSRDRLEDHELRELDLLALGVLRERDHQVFDCYKRYSFHEVVRLMNDYVITVSAEYLDPIKDALYCEAPDVARAAQRADRGLRDDPHRSSLWMAPVLCFTAQDVADELGRATGEPFDVHGAVRVVDLGEKLGNPNKRWTDEIRPRREAILRQLEAFRAAGHKSLEARVRVTPAAGGAAALAVEPGPPGRAVRRVARRAGRRRRARRNRDAHHRRRGAGPDLPALLAPHRRVRRRGRPRPRLCLRCAAVVAAGNEGDPVIVTKSQPPAARRKYLLFTIFAIVSLVLDQWTQGARAPRSASAGPVQPEGDHRRLLRSALRREPGRRVQHAAGHPRGAHLADRARGRRLRARPLLPAQDTDREHPPARRARPGGRRRDRQPRRSRDLRAASPTSSSGSTACTSGRRSTSPTRRCASVSG